MQQLNAEADISRIVKWSDFEGVVRKGGMAALDFGGYLGQMKEDMRDGYGIVYSTIIGNPCLFECLWKENSPMQGRYIRIENNKWEKYEGTLNEYF